MIKLNEEKLTNTSGGIYKGCRLIKKLDNRASKANDHQAALDLVKEWQNCKNG